MRLNGPGVEAIFLLRMKFIQDFNSIHPGFVHLRSCISFDKSKTRSLAAFAMQFSELGDGKQYVLAGYSALQFPFPAPCIGSGPSCKLLDSRGCDCCFKASSHLFSRSNCCGLGGFSRRVRLLYVNPFLQFHSQPRPCPRISPPHPDSSAASRPGVL